jgi:hypothetical protein
VSLVLHVLALTGMVVGLKVAQPPPEGRPIEVELIPPPVPQPRPEPARKPQQVARPNALPALRPHLTPQAPAEASVPVLPATPAPAPAAPPDSGPKGLLPGLSGKLGCDDPLTFHLTPEQRQVCANNLARLGREARPLELNIPDQKKAAYDRYVHCGKVYRNAGVPPSGSNEDGPITGGGVHSNQNPTFGTGAGMGHVPSLKECPVGDR